MWARFVVGALLLTGVLVAAAEAWLRRQRPVAATPADQLQPPATSLEWSSVEERICLVALGDSIVHGHMVPAEGAWPAGLEKRLRNRYPDTGWTVVNRGICGETALQGLARLERDALRFHPHVLFLAFGLNDCYLARSATDVWREVETFPGQTYGPLGKSRLYRAVRRRLSDEEPPWAGAEFSWRPRVGPESFVAALQRMVRAARQAGVAHVSLLTMTPVDDGAHSYWPPEVQALQMSTYHRYNDHIRETARTLGVGLIDAEAGFADSDLAALLDYDGVHLTAAGQERLAEVVSAALDREVILALLRQL